MIDSPTFGLTTISADIKPTSIGAISRPYRENVGASQTWWDNQQFSGELDWGSTPYEAARLAQRIPFRKRVNPETGLLEQVVPENWERHKTPSLGAVSRGMSGPSYGNTEAAYKDAKNKAMADFLATDPDRYYKYPKLSQEEQEEINNQVDELRKKYFKEMMRRQWDPDVL